MKATLGNNISQSGNVIVTIEKNGKDVKKYVTHNTATTALCKYVRDALYGSYVIAKKPGKVKICKKKADGTLEEISNTPYFPLVSSDIEKADNIVSLYFKLLYDNIQGKTIEGLHLYSEAENILYAEVVLPSAIEAETNTNVKVEWQLVITPKTE